MESHGIAIGVALLIMVCAAAFAIAWRAARSVSRFREEHHDNFLGKDRPR